MTKNSMSGAPSGCVPAVGAGVVVAERRAEDDPATQELGVGPVELLFEILPVAPAPEGPVNVVAQHEHQLIGQPVVPGHHLLGDAVLVRVARAAVADDGEADDGWLGRQQARGEAEEAEEAEEAKEATAPRENHSGILARTGPRVQRLVEIRGRG